MNSIGDNFEKAAGPVLSGMSNTHSHAFQRAFVGLTERSGPKGDDFWTWRQALYRFVSLLTPEDVEAIAAQLYVDMLKGGFTSVGEFHYVHHQPNGEAYADPSPLAIINDAYVEGKLNPYPGPKNFGPDSPISWLPEEEMDSMPGMVAEVWPDYKGSTNAAANQERSGVQLLRQVPRALEGQMRLQRAPELVRV